MSPAKTGSAPANDVATPLTKVIEQYRETFTRAGNHALQVRVHDVAAAAGALKRTIAAVRGKLPAELAAALESIDAVL